MHTITFPQNQYTEKVKNLLNQIDFEHAGREDKNKHLVLCLEQPLQPGYELSCNPYFILPIDKLKSPSEEQNPKEIILSWANALENKKYLLPELKVSVHHEIVPGSEIDALMTDPLAVTDPFLREAGCAYEISDWYQGNHPNLTVSQSTGWQTISTYPTHSQMLRDFHIGLTR